MSPRSSSRAARRALRSSSIRATKRALGSSKFIDGAHIFTPSAHAALAALESIPDLLHTKARLAVEGPELCGALDFAFAGGGCLDTLEQALDEVPLAPSDWSPESYGEDLFLTDFVDTCMRITFDGWPAPMNKRFLVRVLGSPPTDPAQVQFRRAILAELAENEDLRGQFVALYRKLIQLRLCFDLLETASHYEETRRRVETLTVLRDTMELAQKEFEQAESGLRRIHEFADKARAQKGYARLEELLEYENDLARVDVQVQLGADGRVRKFNLLGLKENAKNRFHVSPMRRFMGKVGLFFRGYRFGSDELVERWLDHVFDGVKHFVPPILQLLGHMELYLAALTFRELAESKGLEVCFPDLVEDGGRRVRGLFNPLLFKEEITPVPCDLETDSFGTISVVTGPNSGGKTRLLQTLGLTQLLAQGGLFVPAKEARLRPATGLFVSLVGIGDPRAEKGEGRLGSELIRIRRMFETSRPGALVILDEFCSGTNPSEGEEIFYLVLSLLPELGPEVFISTHFLEFTRRLSTDDKDLNLSFFQVELDEHQRPCYTVIPGVASTSLAAQTAARLGVTREELMALVKRHKR